MDYYRINVLNPAAGQGEAKNALPETGENYLTSAVGDARRFVAERCKDADGTLLFCVYGGDGTINEVVAGILDADAADKAVVSVVPTGTGNDFVRGFSGSPDQTVPVDVITCNDSYAVNMINIGFDCDVVESAAKMKKLPLVKGSLAYILGVCDILVHKLGNAVRITLEDLDGITQSFEQEMLLCDVANGAFCGGGFFAAPAAKYNDGIIDMMLIDKVSRLKFISLVSDYRAGKHVTPDGTVADKFRDIIRYIRCRKVRIEGIHSFCADGEVFPCNTLEIGVLPGAVRFLRAAGQ